MHKYDTEHIEIGKIHLIEDEELPNPQAMDDEEYRMLVNGIKQHGQLNPALVIPITEGELEGDYLLVHGEHRLEAVKSLGLPSLYCTIGDPDWTLEKCRVIAAQLNHIHGLPVPGLLTKLVESIERRKKVILSPTEMGLKQREWDALVKRAAANLPKQVGDKVREAGERTKDAKALGEAIHTIMLQAVGSETEPLGYLVFEIKGKTVTVFKVDEALRGWIDLITSLAKSEERSVGEIILERMM